MDDILKETTFAINWKRILCHQIDCSIPNSFQQKANKPTLEKVAIILYRLKNTSYELFHWNTAV